MANDARLRALSLVVREFKSRPLHHLIFQNTISWGILPLSRPVGPIWNRLSPARIGQLRPLYFRPHFPSQTSNRAFAPFTNVILGALWPTSASVMTGTSKWASSDSNSSL